MFLLFLLLSCSNEKLVDDSIKIPIFNHDLGYIPFESEMEFSDFQVCDSSRIFSGRNQMIYKDGNAALRAECQSDFDKLGRLKNFTGYITVRFMMNCNNELGRYKVRALNLDFTPQECPREITEKSLAIIKSKTDWSKGSRYGQETEYSKFINLKFNDGLLEHISL